MDNKGNKRKIGKRRDWRKRRGTEVRGSGKWERGTKRGERWIKEGRREKGSKRNIGG